MIRVMGKDLPWQEGMTVTDLIKAMDDPYPYAVIRMNEKLITRPFFEQTPIPDEAEIFLIPMIAGG